MISSMLPRPLRGIDTPLRRSVHGPRIESLDIDWPPKAERNAAGIN